MRVEAPCVYQLSDFPMDKIVCSWVLESYSYNTATVQVDWLEPAVTLATTDFSASDYAFVGIQHNKLIEVGTRAESELFSTTRPASGTD